MYSTYNDPRWLDPDPLLVVRRYPDPADLETVGLLAAALSLGNAGAIMDAVERLLKPFGKHPAAALDAMDDHQIAAAVAGFRYRFFDAGDIAPFLSATRQLRREHGSLEAAFLSNDDEHESDYAGTASRFIAALSLHAPSSWRALSPHATAPWRSNLFPDPARGSAAKRVFLYLRWMVRRDAIDPGPWRHANPARLVVPLDTHMAAACRRLGLIKRRSTDLKAAREALSTFRMICPDDPVRYDFCMTRPGIHPDLDPDSCFDPFH